MSVDDSKSSAWSAMQAESAERHGLPLNFGGGGGTFDGMDPWQTSVEKRLESLVEMRERLARVETKVDHLPSKDWITAKLQIYVGVMAAITVIATAIAKLL